MTKIKKKRKKTFYIYELHAIHDRFHYFANSGLVNKDFQNVALINSERTVTVTSRGNCSLYESL